MKNVKQVLVFFCALFLFYSLNSCDAINNEKLELEIDWANEDALLSNSHLKKEETVSFPLKNINVKFFEKIAGNVLQRAYIVEEVKAKNESPRKYFNDDIINFGDDSAEDDSEDEDDDKSDERVISTDVTEDSFVNTERKVFQKTLKNKKRTYYYTVYTFNFDLEKLDTQALNAVFMALGTMPEYLNMLTVDQNNNNNNNNDKPWLRETNDGNVTVSNSDDEDSGYGSYYSSFSAVELMDDDKTDNKMTMTVYIMKALQTIDYLINYLVIAAGHKNDAKKAVQLLHEEREYLYKLKDLANGNSSTDNKVWKNKANHERFYLYKALYNIQKVYESLRKNPGSGVPTKKSDTYYEQVIGLVTKSLGCGDVLNTATVLDIVILDNLAKHKKWKPKFSLKEYNESMKGCKSLLEVTLDREDLAKSVSSSEFHDFVNKLRVKKVAQDLQIPELQDGYSDELLRKYKSAYKTKKTSDDVTVDDKTNSTEGEIISPEQEYASMYDNNDRILYGEKVDSEANSYLQKEDDEDDEEDALISDIIKEESKDVQSLLELNRSKSLKFLLDDNEDDEDDDNIDAAFTYDDADDENEELEDEDEDDEVFDFAEYLKKEALAGLNNIRLNIKDAAMETGKKIAAATAKKGEKVLKNVIKKGKGGLKSVANKMSEKTGVKFNTKKNKGITKKSKSGMNEKVNGLNSNGESNHMKAKKSSLRNKRSKTNGTFISLNAEAEKMLKNEDEIKEELEQINIAYKALDDEKNKLENMMIKPTADSDKEIFEQFENYENSIEENKA